MRRLLPPLLGVVIVVVGLIVLLNVFSGRDSAELQTGPEARGPGTLESTPGNPPSSGPADGPNLTRETLVDNAALVTGLSQGNVALVYDGGKPPGGLTDLQERLGPFDPELAAAGQTVFLVQRPGVEGVIALAWKRRLEVDSPTDPQLEDFVETWIGKGEGNTE